MIKKRSPEAGERGLPPLRGGGRGGSGRGGGAAFPRKTKGSGGGGGPSCREGRGEQFPCEALAGGSAGPKPGACGRAGSAPSLGGKEDVSGRGAEGRGGEGVYRGPLYGEVAPSHGRQLGTAFGVGWDPCEWDPAGCVPAGTLPVTLPSRHPR